jgi:hypothetical protein
LRYEAAMLGALLLLSLAQAPDAPPPQPAAPPAASTQCEGCSLIPKDAPPSQAHLLERKIHDLDVRIAAVNESWPSGSVVLMFAGVSFGPLCTAGGAVMIAASASIPALLVPGLIVLIDGLVGVAVLVWGALQASRNTDAARAEKTALTKERDQLQAELDAQPHAARMTPAAPLFALEF